MQTYNSNYSDKAKETLTKVLKYKSIIVESLQKITERESQIEDLRDQIDDMNDKAEELMMNSN